MFSFSNALFLTIGKRVEAKLEVLILVIQNVNPLCLGCATPVAVCKGAQ